MAAPPPPRATAPPACSTSAPAERCPDVNRGLAVPPRDLPAPSAPRSAGTAICRHRNNSPALLWGCACPVPAPRSPQALPLRPAEVLEERRNLRAAPHGRIVREWPPAREEGNAAPQRCAPRDGLGADSGWVTPPLQGESWHGATGKVWARQGSGLAPS